MMHGLDIFSGIGGLSVALKEWVRPIAYCESDPYCQGVLLSRMRDAHITPAPIWDDVKTFPSAPLHWRDVDIIYGGFPCQDISVAGSGAGLAGERSGLFFELLRLVRETSPGFVFLENVPAIRTKGLRQIIGAFTEFGFDCRWTLVSAEAVGAPHRRSRWFLLAANPKRLELWDEQGRGSGAGGARAAVSADDGQEAWREPQPGICRMDDGPPADVDRLRALGNAVVPCQAREAFKGLMGLS